MKRRVGAAELRGDTGRRSSRARTAATRSCGGSLCDVAHGLPSGPTSPAPLGGAEHLPKLCASPGVPERGDEHGVLVARVLGGKLQPGEAAAKVEVSWTLPTPTSVFASGMRHTPRLTSTPRDGLPSAAAVGRPGGGTGRRYRPGVSALEAATLVMRLRRRRASACGRSGRAFLRTARRSAAWSAGAERWCAAAPLKMCLPHLRLPTAAATLCALSSLCPCALSWLTTASNPTWAPAFSVSSRGAPRRLAP